jgi:hypothetical protein
MRAKWQGRRGLLAGACVQAVDPLMHELWSMMIRS